VVAEFTIAAYGFLTAGLRFGGGIGWGLLFHRLEEDGSMSRENGIDKNVLALCGPE
jgi:hypothetical protein